MATLGLRSARLAALTSLLVGGCFHDAMPDLQPAGTSTSAGSTGGAPGSTGAGTTGIATSGTTTEPATTEPATTDPATTDPATTDPALDMGGPARFTCPSDQALVACYLFEAGYDAHVLVDDGPAGLDGTMTGAAPIDGYRGSAAGTSVETAISVSAPALARTAEWSVTAWVRPDAPPQGFRSGVLDRDGDYGIFVLASGVAHCGGQIGLSSQSELPLGTWTHITCVWQQDKGVRIFINGELEAEGPWQNLQPIGDPPLVIANDSPSVKEQALIGAVDEVMLWRRLLTKDDICAVAGAGC